LARRKRGLTLHRDDKKDQTILLDVVLDEVSDEVDIGLVLIPADRLYDTGKVDESEIRNVGSRNVDADNILAESELLDGSKREWFHDLWKLVVHEAGGVDGRVEDGQLSAAKGCLY
jgi:hypothetical protein